MSDETTGQPAATSVGEANNDKKSTPLENLVLTRHSIRYFKPDPIPRSLLLSCLHLSTHAPSNSNIQPWRLHLATGSRRDKIITALQEVASQGPPAVAPLPDHLKHFRSEFGHLLYGPSGYDIPRTEPGRHKAAQMRNYEFFGAPTIGLISIVKGLTMVDAMTVGMFVQTFMLALVERGAGSCLQVSVVGFPEVMRREFGLDEDLELLCGIAIGWPEEHQKVNEIVVPREEVERFVNFLE